jgi:hypothetical protein
MRSQCHNYSELSRETGQLVPRSFNGKAAQQTLEQGRQSARVVGAYARPMVIAQSLSGEVSNNGSPLIARAERQTPNVKKLV